MSLNIEFVIENKEDIMSLTKEFMQITGCASDTTAKNFLERNGMDINSALNDYFNNAASSIEQSVSMNNRDKIDQIFSKYADSKDPNIMDFEGTIEYLSDLNIDVENDIEAIIVAYLLESPSTGIFERLKFVNNWCKVQADVSSIQKMSDYLHYLVNDPEIVKDVYKFAFKYALDEGKRKLNLQDAISLWKVMYKKQFLDFETNGTVTTVTRFINDFLQTGKSGKENISKDEWDMAFSFFKIPLDQLETHSESAAWPVLMDDFVEFLFDRE